MPEVNPDPNASGATQGPSHSPVTEGPDSSAVKHSELGPSCTVVPGLSLILSPLPQGSI